MFVLASWLVLGILVLQYSAVSFVLMIPNDTYFILYFQGNRLFKEGKFELAKAKYEKAIHSACTLFTLRLIELLYRYSIDIISKVITRSPKLFC